MVTRGTGAILPRVAAGGAQQVKFIGAVDDQWQMFRSVLLTRISFSKFKRLLCLREQALLPRESPLVSLLSSCNPLNYSLPHPRFWFRRRRDRAAGTAAAKATATTLERERNCEQKSNQQPRLSDDPADYEIGAPIGFGATSVVRAALYAPSSSSSSSAPSNKHTAPLPCAVKVVDLDKLPPQALRLLRRETQLMSLSKHPNVLRVRGSWVAEQRLHIALRLMNAGSAADIMRYGWPAGMEEEVVKCILRQALEGLK